MPSHFVRVPCRVAIWLEGKQEMDEDAFIFFMLSANSVQNQFEFYFPSRSHQQLTFSQALANYRGDRRIYDEPYDIHIFIVSHAIEEDDLFADGEGPVGRITTLGWERQFAPPSLFEYLFHTILFSVITILCKEIDTHEKYTIGCPFDYSWTKSHMRAAVVLGTICREHRSQIRECLGERILAAADELFSFRWLGDSSQSGDFAHKLKEQFGQDLRYDTGYRKGFFRRVREKIDALWFDFIKEIVRGLILIVVAYLLFKFGLKQ